MIRVEPARAQDALPTLALHRDVLAEDRFFVTRPDELACTLEQREHEIAVLGAAPNACFLVARLPDVRVAGFLVVNGGALARTRHVGRIELMIGAAYRRRGVGRALLDTAVGWASRTGVVSKLSLVVLADNAPAIALYRAVGFVEEGRRTGEYREEDGTLRDDLLMARQVASSSAHSASRR